MNQECARFFGGWQPARTTVGVASLPGGALVEIEATAGGDTVAESARKKYQL
ncbi:MAG: RidA family protein [Candidatus Aenigmarchaeota archaeon]|nr:RidA family protein [Candidatus Aenigmarchaeota archaeon]